MQHRNQTWCQSTLASRVASIELVYQVRHQRRYFAIDIGTDHENLQVGTGKGKSKL